ncbi:MAG: cupin domain-containing protein [Actinomycetota bacterium]
MAVVRAPGAIAGVLATLLVAFWATAVAASTPTDTYQAIEAVNAQLAAFHDANGTMPAADPQAPPLTPRSPRHVLQKAREVLLKVQALRQLNGLPLQPVPEIPVREVQPEDVKLFIEKMLAGLKDLRPVFGNPPVAPVPRGTSPKSPTDNFIALRRAELQIDGLGLPPTAPNDVMRIALSMVNDLELIRAALGITDPVPHPAVIPARRPADTYENAFGLLTDLKGLADGNPALSIPMGVVLLNKRGGTIKPAHVMDLLGTVLAEISAMKVKVGIHVPTQLAPLQTGMTPSDVHATVSFARALIATIPGARRAAPVRETHEQPRAADDAATRVYQAAEAAKVPATAPRRTVISQSEYAIVTTWTVPPGQNLASHRHPEGQDTWVVLSGEAEYLLGESRSRHVQAGDVAIANAGQMHGARNSGTTPFVFISIVAPPDAGVETGDR